jgi:hypothetical protein
VLKVVGQTRLQDAFVLAQLAKHASAVASANRSLLLPAIPGSASAVPIRESNSATLNARLIEKLRIGALFEIRV